MKPLIIGLVVVIAGLATWRIIAGRVDLTKPEAVARAFISALKTKDVDKASKYWVPESAETWRTSASDKLEHMGSGSMERFFEDMADGTVAFVAATPNPKAPPNERTLTSGGTSLDLRQVGDKWYVCKAPI